MSSSNLPDLLSAQDGKATTEFCTRMAFKVTPTYSSKLQAALRWQQVIAAAQQKQGGGWDLNFSHTDIEPAKLEKLADIIDRTFLNGSFKQACKPSYVVRDKLTGDMCTGLSDTAICNAVAGFEPATNSLIFFRQGWQRRPSLRRPVQADGVYCLSKLQWLCHAMGHEMVHCMVHNVCPESRSYAAYQHSNGHGPIFMRLNRHIFGHSSSMYKPGWSRLSNMQVQWGNGSSSSGGGSGSSSS